MKKLDRCQIRSGVCSGYGSVWIYRYATRVRACEKCAAAVKEERKQKT